MPRNGRRRGAPVGCAPRGGAGLPPTGTASPARTSVGQEQGTARSARRDAHDSVQTCSNTWFRRAWSFRVLDEREPELCCSKPGDAAGLAVLLSLASSENFTSRCRAGRLPPDERGLLHPFRVDVDAVQVAWSCVEYPPRRCTRMRGVDLGDRRLVEAQGRCSAPRPRRRWRAFQEVDFWAGCPGPTSSIATGTGSRAVDPAVRFWGVLTAALGGRARRR